MEQDNFEQTITFKIQAEEVNKTRSMLLKVYAALKEKGYHPINQLVGYLLSGDPAYITSYNNARNLIKHIERDDLLEELLKNYLEK